MGKNREETVHIFEAVQWLCLFFTASKITCQGSSISGSRKPLDSDKTVIDIGGGKLVKYGSGVRLQDGHVISYIAARTVPKIHAVLMDPSSSITYITQEVHGISFDGVLEFSPLIPSDVHHVINGHLSRILQQMAPLDSARAQLGPYGSGGKFLDRCFGMKECCAKTTTRLVDFFLGLLMNHKAMSLENKDGFIPLNIFVDHETGNVTGIINWGSAGWLPYFWNDFVMRGWGSGEQWDEMVEKLLPYDGPRHGAICNQRGCKLKE
ncbi:hypothetical protein B0H17DRAFT_1129508 [Mycena rosella]|uniref:Aminoglycoside phosphotransferase domain-containing protein n=1 Tax=Mycena rosella TaxID=1033263 RepID=A0AAD7GQ11_MYCRO|nr:hypothetical protein B0H17DRAFT_1129508 [Mycena rosella]